eukprot:3313992-Pyramimonas_sp.AAC.1
MVPTEPQAQRCPEPSGARRLPRPPQSAQVSPGKAQVGSKTPNRAPRKPLEVSTLLGGGGMALAT